VTLSDNTQNGIKGIGLSFASGLPTIVVADTVRSEGDTLIVSTRGGNDTHRRSAADAGPRCAAHQGGRQRHARGSRFNDVIDSGLGSDFCHRRPGPGRVLRCQPERQQRRGRRRRRPHRRADENEIDTLVENLARRSETFSADVGLYNNRLVIGNLLSAGAMHRSNPARMRPPNSPMPATALRPTPSWKT
jgi:hypothetical protein